MPLGRTPKTTDEWLTPREIHDALGGADSFDLDPSSPVVRPWSTARHHYTVEDNGLLLRWFGRVFLNPPYGRSIGAWLGRMAGHGRGVALIFARTDTEAFHRHVWEASAGLLFLEGRLDFLRPDGTPFPKTGRGGGRAGAPSVLCAYGDRDLEILATCGLAGALVPLRLGRGVVALALEGTWREEVEAVVAGRRSPVLLADLYRLLADHPKARRNRNYRAKIRQVLQQGPFRRVARGQWECAA